MTQTLSHLTSPTLPPSAHSQDTQAFMQNGSFYKHGEVLGGCLTVPLSLSHRGHQQSRPGHRSSPLLSQSAARGQMSLGLNRDSKLTKEPKNQKPGPCRLLYSDVHQGMR